MVTVGLCKKGKEWTALWFLSQKCKDNPPILMQCLRLLEARGRLPFKLIEYQTCQCCEIKWGSGVPRFEYCVSYAAVKYILQAVPGFNGFNGFKNLEKLHPSALKTDPDLTLPHKCSLFIKVSVKICLKLLCSQFLLSPRLKWRNTRRPSGEQDGKQSVQT